MSATTATAMPAGIRWIVADALAITKRNLLRYIRIPMLIVFSTIQPVMFVLLFTYVFGGAIGGVRGNYVDFLMPGVFLQTVVFGSMGTGIGLAEDLATGIVDRFKSLPMARSAVLAGRTLSDMVRNTFVMLLMTGVGTLVGFRFHNGFVAAVGALGMGVLFGFAFSWISATVGLYVRDPESVQAASFVWSFPLVFASSAFVPIETMPGWLQAWVKINPVALTIDTMRALVLGGPVMIHAWKAFVWVIAILLVFMPLAVRRYRRT